MSTAQNQLSPEETKVQKEFRQPGVAVAGTLDLALQPLAKFGGYDLLESAIDHVQNLNPERKARKKIFLEEGSKKEERAELRKTLSWWIDILNGSDDLAEMVTNSSTLADTADKTLKANIKRALERTIELERSYRSVAFFFKNTESTKIKNVSFMNADPDQLKDLDNTRFIDFIQQELVNNYDRLDLRYNYSILILPGYLGSNKVVEKWAKIAYENKVILVTDFENLDSPDDVMELFEAANLTGGDPYRSNVVMACNWLVGRGKEDVVGEEDHLYIPPSSSLGGKIYYTLMSQVTAGKKHGSMNEVDGVKFKMKKSEIASLEKLGLIPMAKEYGKVMAFSAKTLFNGDNIGLQTYSVVRVFDYVTKVLMDFLNRRAFENFTANTRKELNSQIVKFLDSITGPNKLIENFVIKRFEQDPIQKDRVFLDIHLKPYFPAKTFLIKLEGHKGDDPENVEWMSKYEQEGK